MFWLPVTPVFVSNVKFVSPDCLAIDTVTFALGSVANVTVYVAVVPSSTVTLVGEKVNPFGSLSVSVAVTLLTRLL